MNYFLDRRKALGLTQHQVGDALDVTAACVGTWERGESSPPIGRANELAAVYRTDEPDMVLQIARQAREIRDRQRGGLAREVA